jgi:hypothetical protein
LNSLRLTPGICSLLEYVCLLFTEEDADGDFQFFNALANANTNDKATRKTTRPPQTTVEQFVCNALWVPVLLQIRGFIGGPIARVLVFPLLVWTTEVVQGYTLIALFGFNPAWNYRGRHVFLDGNIKLSMWHMWLACGVLFEIICVVFWV